MNNLIKDPLNLGHLESGRFKINKESFNIVNDLSIIIEIWAI